MKPPVQEDSDEDCLTPSNQSLLSNTSFAQSVTSEQHLSPQDHLSHPDALDFWLRYFPAHPVNQVPLDIFCDAIQAEFSLSVLKSTLQTLSSEAQE